MKPGYTYRARVLRVYDGDTIYVDLDLGCGVHLTGHDGKGEPIRLLGLDTPEVRGEERERGLAVRDLVAGILLDTDVIIETKLDRKGKYGRLLGTVWCEGEDGWYSLNEWLLGEGHAEATNY